MTLQDNYGQATSDPFTPTVPTNLESVNYLSTGPDLDLRFGGLTFLNLSARVARAQYDTSPFSSDRGLGGLAWGWQLSAQSTLSLSADTERVLFENTVVNTDFDRSNAYVRYALQGARTELSADLGGTMVDESGTSVHGGLAKAMLSRRLSAFAKLTLSFGRYLTDGSSSFSNMQSGALGVVGTAPATVSSQNYTSNYASLGWQYERNRTSIALSGRWEKDLYEGQSLLDRTLATAEFSVRRRLTRAFTAQLIGRFYESDYLHASAAGINGSPKTDTSSVEAAVTWRHGRGLELKIGCEHTTYTTSPNDTGYGDNRIVLTIGYRPYRDQPGFSELPSI